MKASASRRTGVATSLCVALLLGACGPERPGTPGPTRGAAGQGPVAGGSVAGGSVAAGSGAAGSGAAGSVVAGSGAAGSVGRGTVVARVGEARILAGDVVDLARATGLSPREALDRLVGEVLLGREAERRGYGARSEVAAEARRASVRAWLAAEVERALPASAITDAEIAATYAAHSARFVRPEERMAVHVLLPLAEDAGEARIEAARRLSEQALSVMRSEGPAAALARFQQDPHALSGAFAVVAEEVRGLVRGGAFDPAFLDAVFALPGPGVVPQPVRSRFGWHAIVVVAMRPDATISLDAARDVLRTELLSERRAARLDALAAALGATTPPQVDARAAARLAQVSVDDAPRASGVAP